MIEGILTLDDVRLKGKTIILRLDINSPLDGNKRISDTTRIKESLATIRELMERGAKIVGLSHQGGDLEYGNFISLKEHAGILRAYLGKSGKNLKFIEDVIGPESLRIIKGLKNGQMLLLENIRILAEETVFFEEKILISSEEKANTFLVRKLSPLADLYINDAFASVHRSAPSVTGFPQVLPSACGRLFEKEITFLRKFGKRIKHPSIYLLGGSKISDAFRIMDKALKTGGVDKVLTMGLVANIMLLASGRKLGLCSEQAIKEMDLAKYISCARGILNRSRRRIILPLDLAYVKGGRRELRLNDLPVKEPLVDIGSKTIEFYTREINNANTIFLNGPAGCFEKKSSSLGTEKIWRAIAESGATSIIGGGHTISAAKKFGVIDKFSFVSTAGGGLISYLADEDMPSILALRKSAECFHYKRNKA